MVYFIERLRTFCFLRSNFMRNIYYLFLGFSLYNLKFLYLIEISVCDGNVFFIVVRLFLFFKV